MSVYGMNNRSLKFFDCVMIGAVFFFFFGFSNQALGQSQKKLISAQQQKPLDLKDLDIDDIDFMKEITIPTIEDVPLNRNFFRPLIGPGSLRAEIIEILGVDPEEPQEPVMPTPDTLGLVLKGTLIADQRLAYVESPEEDLVLRIGDAVSTMQVENIETSNVFFILENGQTAVLSNEFLAPKTVRDPTGPVSLTNEIVETEYFDESIDYNYYEEE